MLPVALRQIKSQFGTDYIYKVLKAFCSGAVVTQQDVVIYLGFL